ncbi:MAG: putative rane protein, partial [Acidobacteriaceae bacterium]|nr:putative rane protein [Acidobacteriaceae bacterium]
MHIPRSIRSIAVALVLALMPALLVLATPAPSFAGVFVSVNIAPPALPVYTQPLCPGEGYIWTPGYWAYGDDGYYWVPGTWVMAPQVGFLWTPGYWGWGDDAYIWHAGYWGPHVGFYGGVNYGFGYIGHGYEGGYWDHDRFAYNRTVNNVNITNVHVYNKTVINNVTVNRVSYNGGRGGISERPRPEEERAAHERHIERTAMQDQHERGASSNRALLASVNHGRPAIAATARPGQFNNRNVVPARAAGAPYHPADNRVSATRGNNSVPRPGNRADYNSPRQQNMSRNNSPSRNNVPRPQNNVTRESAPRERAPQRENTSRMQSSPRPAYEPR